MKFLLSLLGLLPASWSAAQTAPAPPVSEPIPTPVELMTGNNYLLLQSLIVKDFGPGSKFGFFNLTNFAADYQNRLAKNSFFNKATVKYSFVKTFNAFVGLNIDNTLGFRPLVGAEYFLANPTWLVVVQAGADLTGTHNPQAFTITEYTPHFTPNWGLFGRVQAQYVRDVKHHEDVQSYLYFRLGASHRTVQFGVGADFNWLGPEHNQVNNFGPFVRKQFK